MNFSPPAPPPEMAEALARLSYANFLTLVDADVREEVRPEEAAWLRQPEQVDAWVEALRATIRQVDDHIARAQIDLIDADPLGAKAIRRRIIGRQHYRNHVQKRLDEALAIQAQHPLPTPTAAHVREQVEAAINELDNGDALEVRAILWTLAQRLSPGARWVPTAPSPADD